MKHFFIFLNNKIFKSKFNFPVFKLNKCLKALKHTVQSVFFQNDKKTGFIC